MASTSTQQRQALRSLPAVDEALRLTRVAALVERSSRELVAEFVRGVLDEWRAEILSGRVDAEALAGRLQRGELEAQIEARAAREARSGLQRVVNATGVVLHTGLGRAPVHPEAAEAMAVAAASYGTVEVSRETGERNERDGHLGELLARATGAEAGIAVNNNAGAVFLTLQTFAGGREALVSRGELVEIGGSFRLPDVMTRAGVDLREVGTTNRTRIADYRRAIGERSALLLKVHSSNFRVIGFTEEVSAEELAALGREAGVVTAFDLGSGRLEADGAQPLDMLGGEPVTREAVQSGVDLVMFSGDKLLGGPQAGLIVGRREAVAALRKNPIYRALRLDKVTLAGLQATLELLLAGRGDELPTRRMLCASADEVEPSARRIAAALGALAGFEVEVVAGGSQPGSGSAPDVYLDTWVVRVRHATLGPAALARALRLGEPPVFGRVQDEALLLDPRTLLGGDEERLVEGFGRIG